MITGLGATLAAVFACALYIYLLGPTPTGGNLGYSHIVLDHAGRLLRGFATKEGRWRLPIEAKDVDPRFLRLLFAYEDKRFYQHSGVDPWSLGRAALQLITSGHVVSGGSTITMQVARLLEPREHRSIGAKLRQITRAFELERLVGRQRRLQAVAGRNLVVVAPSTQSDSRELFIIRAGRLVEQRRIRLPARAERLERLLRGAFGAPQPDGPISREVVDEMLQLESWLRRERAVLRCLPVDPSAPEVALPALLASLRRPRQPRRSEQPALTAIGPGGE